MEAGIYKIEVYSPDNLGKYVLVVGERDVYPPREIISATTFMPQQKAGFLNEDVLAIFSGRNGLYMLVPIAVLFLFFLSGIIITVSLAKQRWKEGLVLMEKKKR